MTIFRNIERDELRSPLGEDMLTRLYKTNHLDWQDRLQRLEICPLPYDENPLQ